MKKFWIILLLLVMIIPNNVAATKLKKEKINVYIFYGSTCPHCHHAFEFFDSIEEDYGKYYNIKRYETWLWDNIDNSKALEKVAAHFGTAKDKIGVPYIVIGDKVFLGYSEDYNDEIKEQIVNTYNEENKEKKDVVGPILNNHFNNTRICLISLIVSLLVLIFVGVTNYLVRYTPKKMNS